MIVRKLVHPKALVGTLREILLATQYGSDNRPGILSDSEIAQLVTAGYATTEDLGLDCYVLLTLTPSGERALQQSLRA